jgi:hypothetical protein
VVAGREQIGDQPRAKDGAGRPPALQCPAMNILVIGSGIIAAVMVTAFVAGIVLMVVLLVRYGIKQMEAYVERLRTFAAEMDLEFTPQTGPWYSRKPPRVTGTFRDRQVKLDHYVVSHGKSSTTYMRMEVLDVDTGGQSLALSSENFLTKVFQAVGGSDVKLGDPGFDEKIYVRASSEDFAREVLADAEVREKALAVIGTSRAGLTAENRVVRWRAVGLHHDVELLVVALDLLCDLADGVENARGRPA